MWSILRPFILIVVLWGLARFIVFQWTNQKKSSPAISISTWTLTWFLPTGEIILQTWDLQTWIIENTDMRMFETTWDVRDSLIADTSSWIQLSWTQTWLIWNKTWLVVQTWFFWLTWSTQSWLMQTWSIQTAKTWFTINTTWWLDTWIALGSVAIFSSWSVAISSWSNSFTAAQIIEQIFITAPVVTQYTLMTVFGSTWVQNTWIQNNTWVPNTSSWTLLLTWNTWMMQNSWTAIVTQNTWLIISSSWNVWWVIKTWIISPTSTPQKSCRTPRWASVEHGDYTLAFWSPSWYVCRVQKRYCSSWKLEWSYGYHTCRFQLWWYYEYNSMTWQSLDIISISDNLGTWTMVNPTTWNIVSSIQPSNEQDINTWSQIEASYANVKDFPLFERWWQAPTPPLGMSVGKRTQQQILSDTLIQQRNPAWNGFFGYQRPQQRKNIVIQSPSAQITPRNISPWVCRTPRWQVLGTWQSTYAFENSQTPDWIQCKFEIRYCNNGVLWGSYAYPTCDQIYQPIISLTGTEQVLQILWWDDTNDISQPLLKPGESSSVIWAARPYPRSCVVWSSDVSHGSSIVTYRTSRVAYGLSCESQTRVCTDGTLSGSYTATACMIDPPTWCMFGTTSVPHGATVMAASSSWPCAYQPRLCSNGILQWTYTQSICK